MKFKFWLYIRKHVSSELKELVDLIKGNKTSKQIQFCFHDSIVNGITVQLKNMTYRAYRLLLHVLVGIRLCAIVDVRTVCVFLFRVREDK